MDAKEAKQILNKMEFISVSDSISNIYQTQKAIKEKILKFGIPVLDKATGGILKNDLILIAAKTGAGKTELATNIAMNNALDKKRVYYFALEAFKHELTFRIKYRVLSKLFYNSLQGLQVARYPNFQDWLLGKQDDLLSQFEVEAETILSNDLKTLFIGYKEKEFLVSNLANELLSIHNKADLIIIDHFHYLDFEDENENRSMKLAMQTIRNISIEIGVPVILVVHLRKSDRKDKQIIPSIEDIQGSSDIAKISTKCIIVSPSLIQQTSDKHHLRPTYIKIAKNRIDGSRCYYTYQANYNTRRNNYTNEIIIGNFIKEDFIAIDPKDVKYPSWAKT